MTAIRTHRPNRWTSRLQLNRLEDREVPAVWTVTDLTDSGQPGSLRYAVGAAFNVSQYSGRQDVVFAPGLAGTITLTGSPITGYGNGGVTIAGPGTDKL